MRIRPGGADVLRRPLRGGMSSVGRIPEASASGYRRRPSAQRREVVAYVTGG